MVKCAVVLSLLNVYPPGFPQKDPPVNDIHCCTMIRPHRQHTIPRESMERHLLASEIQDVAGHLHSG